MPGTGELLALLAPLAWSVAVILFRKAEGVPPEVMNFFKNSVAAVLLGLTMLALGTPLPDRSARDWIAVAGSGLLGLAIADTLLFAGLARIGAARLAVVDTVYAPTVMLLSVIALGERITGWFFVGAVAVLSGVALATVEPGALSRPSDAPGSAEADARAELRKGMLYAWAAITLTAAGVVLVKRPLESSDLVEATWSRLVAGVVGQAIWLTLRGQMGRVARAMIDPQVWRAMLPATMIGTWLSLLLWLGGFKWAPASVAAVLNQMATVYILILARIFLGELIPPRRAAGALLAAAGALCIVLTRPAA